MALGHPDKDWDEHKVGQDVQVGYNFLEKLFKAGTGAAIRNKIWKACAGPGGSEAKLRKLLKNTYHLQWIPAGAHIMIVDIENARVWPSPLPAGWKQKNWYTLVLPPLPRRSGSTEYKEERAWESAWYHAMADSYGM